MNNFLEILSIAAFPALIAFLWFKTDAFYTYGRKLANVFFELDFFFKFYEYENTKRLSKHNNLYSKFIKLKYHDTWFGELLGCWVCFVTFLGLLINLLNGDFKTAALSVIISYTYYFIIVKIYGNLKKNQNNETK